MVKATERWIGGVLFVAATAVVPLACATSSTPTNSSASSGSGPASSGATSTSGTGGQTGTSSTTTSPTGSTTTNVAASSSTVTTTSSTTTTTASSTTTGSSSSGACSPQPTADTNAVMCPAGQCTTMGNMGYDYAYGDTGPQTIYCVGTNEACLAGTMSAVNPPSYSYYGIGVGINLAGGTPPPPVQLTGAGITVKLSNVPSGGARLLVTVGGTDYCAPITTNPATITWADFNSKCYDSPPDGTGLSGAPNTPHIEVQAVAGTSVQNVDFCIEQLSWQ